MRPFFNQHTHTSLSLYRGLGSDLKLHDWLEQFIWPLEKEFCNEEMVYLGTLLSLCEMIKSGTGAACVMDFHTKAVAKAFTDVGVRGIIGEALFTSSTPSCSSPDEVFDYILSIKEISENQDLITPIVAIHAPFTSSPELYARAHEFASMNHLQATSHVAETEWEVSWSLKKYKKSPVALLESTGIFEGDFVLIHGVHLSTDDMEILGRYSIPVIHNPHSNMMLGSGVCPVPELLSRNICVGLGTDSAASNNNLSMLRELQSMSRLHKVINNDASVLDAETAIRIASKAGHEIYPSGINEIVLDSKADLMIVDLSGIHNQPDYDVARTLAYSACNHDIKSLIVNGKLLMEDKKLLTLDESLIIKEAMSFSKRVKEFLIDKGL